MYKTLNTKLTAVRTVVLAVSAFLIISIGNTSTVSAMPIEVVTERSTVNTKVEAPAIVFDKKIVSLKKQNAVKQSQVNKKIATVKEVKSKAKATSQTKEQLAQQVAQLKAEVEAKKVAVEQKKAAEAAVVAQAAPQTVCRDDQWLRADNGQCMDKPSATASGGIGGGDEGTISASAPVRAYAASSSGNLYEAGQCTWHVKNLRPDLPNNLGNADQWYWNAQALGLSTGTAPSPGAVGVRISGMHVVYVQAVNGDGTITVSEMNYDYIPFNQRVAVKSAADFYYIY